MVSGQALDVAPTSAQAIDTEVRELIRRSRLDPATEDVAVKRLITDAVRDFDERCVRDGRPLLDDPDATAKRLWDEVAGYGPLQTLSLIHI